MPCELETEEGLRLEEEGKKNNDKCPASCPFNWYCKIIASATTHFTRDFIELFAGFHFPLEDIEGEAANAIRLIVKVYAKRQKMVST